MRLEGELESVRGTWGEVVWERTSMGTAIWVYHGRSRGDWVLDGYFFRELAGMGEHSGKPLWMVDSEHGYLSGCSPDELGKNVAWLGRGCLDG